MNSDIQKLNGEYTLSEFKEKHQHDPFFHLETNAIYIMYKIFHINNSQSHRSVHVVIDKDAFKVLDVYDVFSPNSDGQYFICKNFIKPEYYIKNYKLETLYTVRNPIYWIDREKNFFVDISQTKCIKNDIVFADELIIFQNVNRKVIKTATNAYKLIETKHDGSECCVCFEPILQKIALVPCGHTSVCADCCDIDKCPLCRQTIEKTIKLY